MILLTVLALLVVFLENALFGERGIFMGLVFSILISLGVYRFNDRCVLSMHRAQPLSEEEASEVFKILKSLSERAGIPMPRLFMIPSAAANAFSTGRSPRHATIVVTHGLVGLLNKEELSGVLGHELSHILRRDTLLCSIVAVFAGALSLLASLFRWSFLWGGERDDRDRENPLPLLLFAVVMPFVALLIRFTLSKTLEFRADQSGGELCGNPLYLVSALQKIAEASKKLPLREASPATAHLFIVAPLREGKWNRLFRNHPPMELRIRRLEKHEEPTFLRR